MELRIEKPTDLAGPGSGGGDGFGLYVHWPFCLSKCPYCDFNSHVREHVDHRRWRAAYLRELDHVAASLGDRGLQSIFFGGGTPSLMDPDTAGAIIDKACGLWPPVTDCEITLEANPGAADESRFSALFDAGVNRLSLGVQALDDVSLAFLGRGHNVAEALGALGTAQKVFPRVSFDLMYGRPGQTEASWRRELKDAIGFGTSHLSAYQLTIEPGTPFYGAVRRGVFVMPKEGLAADLFEATNEVLEGAGLAAYEISNHARPGDECRHNLLYWRGEDYAGIGPGAHQRLAQDQGVMALYRLRRPEDWLEQVERLGHGTAEQSRLSQNQRITEIVMMGLRLRQGIGRDRFRRQAGGDFADILGPRTLDRLITAGAVQLDGGHLAATDFGRQRLDTVILELVAGLDQDAPAMISV
ncbi:MAG: radical SAM family heme chaperone HemW [Alphaproteobacteria bacterium]